MPSTTPDFSTVTGGGSSLRVTGGRSGVGAPAAGSANVEGVRVRRNASDRARSDRGREEAPPRSRTPSTFNAPNNVAPGPERYAPMRTSEQPPVTVLKSGIVDGMAYSLYSDGSIEAQMPEGMMRFASIDELRSHLDQRP